MAANPEAAAEVGGDDAPVVDAAAADIEALYRRSRPAFLRVAQAITRDADAAHDAVQEGFARALRAGGRLRRPDALEPWVWRTVVNAARDRRRADERRRRREAGDGALAAVAAPDAAPADAALAAAVGGLPERQRLVLFLRYYADLDHRGIATALGIRPGTVGAALHAAHANLRRRLEEGT
jgi:RNA polymerase sigma factor (sigma-70 family)